MKNFVLKIVQALILSVFALVVLLNSELSNNNLESQTKKLDFNTSVSFAEPLR